MFPVRDDDQGRLMQTAGRQLGRNLREALAVRKNFAELSGSLQSAEDGASSLFTCVRERTVVCPPGKEE